jgi:hypothetical protein
VSAQVSRLREPVPAPLAGVGLLAGVHHGVAAQVADCMFLKRIMFTKYHY